MKMLKRGSGPDEALGRYRNALVAGASSVELANLDRALDPAIVQTLHQMRALRQGEQTRPRPDFANALERAVLAAFGNSPDNTQPLAFSPHVSPNGHASHAVPPPMPTPVDVARRRWTATHLAMAAALLLAVLAGALLARTFFPPRTTTVLNAPHEPMVETLVDSLIEGASESWTPLTVERWTIQPGPATLAIPALDGPQWLVPDAGPAVLSIDGVDETVPSNAGVVVPSGATLVVSNPGGKQISVYRGVAASGFALKDYDRGAISKETALDTEAHEALPPGESRVVFERLTLHPGTTLVLEPASGQDWLAIASGELGVTLIGDGLPLNWQSGHEREIADGELLPALAPGTRVLLRNIGDDPLILLRLRVIPTATTSEPRPDTPIDSGAARASAMAPTRQERAQ